MKRTRLLVLALCLMLGGASLAYLNLLAFPALLSGSGGAVGIAAHGEGAVASGNVEAEPLPEIEPVPADPHKERPDAPAPSANAFEEGPALGLENQERELEIVLLHRPNQYRLTHDHRSELEKVLEHIPDRDRTWARVSGHSDATGGSAVDNDLLSRKRAQEVAAFLLEQGVPSGQIMSEWHGARLPVARGGTPAALERNRRVEVNLFGEKP